ncbi:unnamed protein product [Mytilus coruscus]|uniref:Uncharacterized protein n=1 Tax=Mytilus coruscus TaxID=42192 RepID=A0A6J8E0H6_MYTCO|nr:unnamed protein product [Mytilus coruscus]
MVVRSQLDQQDSQQDRDGQQQQNDRVFSPLSQDWRIPHFEPPRSRPPPQAPTNLQTYKQYMSCLTYPSLGQPNLSGPPGMSSFQPQLHALPVSHQQVSMSGTQQQPPPSGAPQTHYNQPLARRRNIPIKVITIRDNAEVIQLKGNTTIFIHRTVCAKGQTPTICFLNITDNQFPKGEEVGYTQEVRVIQSMEDEPLPSVSTCTTESTVVPVLPDVECNLDFLVSAPTLDQQEVVDTWFSTHIDLICLPTTAHIIINDENSCHVIAITQSVGINFTTEEIKTKQSEDHDLLLLLNWLKNKKSQPRTPCF